jgi:hypothetical protein
MLLATSWHALQLNNRRFKLRWIKWGAILKEGYIMLKVGVVKLDLLVAECYDKVRQSVTSKSKSKNNGPITGSDLGRNGLIRGFDWSILSAFAFAP